MVYVFQINQYNSPTIQGDKMALADIIPNSTLALNTTLWVCEHTTKFQRNSKGIFYNGNPLNYTLSVVSLQASLVCLSTTWLQSFLIPFGETTFIPQVLGGLLTGPSILGQIKNLDKLLFAPKPFYVCEAISLYGTLLFLFLMGVKIDISVLMRLGKKNWAIGLCSCVLPLILTISSALVLRQILTPETDLYKNLFYIAAFSSTGSFQVTASVLEDFKLLNSEVGRLAISSCMINGFISAVWQGVVVAHQQRVIWKVDIIASKMMAISLLAMVLIIICVLRPIMSWMIRNTPEGKPLKESYIVAIYLMLLTCSLYSEVSGEHYIVGPVLLGLTVPDGPPLGSGLVERLQTLTSALFMPLFFFSSSAKFKLSLVDAYGFAIVQPVAIIGFFGKLLGTMLPSLYCKMSLTDSLSLGLIMSSQGITHLLHLQSLQYLRIIDDRSYAQMFIALIWLTAASNPIVKFLYDPSKSYLSFTKRRTIEHALSNAVLPLMACIHYEEDTLPMINCLEMSHSTIENPICFHVLHLVELTGRTIPVLIDHQHENKANNTLHSKHSQSITNVFKSYEQHNMGNVMVKLYTSISPFETMHDEICLQAAQKRVCMLIVPFHKQWRDGQVMESAHHVRTLNLHLLRTAPCSVGILVERGKLTRNNPLNSVSFYSVGIVFIEGPDDREALAYAMRMADHSNIKVTLIRLMEPCMKSRQLMNRDPDGDLIHKFKVDYIQIKRHDYREEVLRDSVEMVSFIKSLEGCFDLILAGRCHENDSSLFSGFNEWNEYPELGSVADMLVSSDSTFDGSVLVVQQNRVGVGHHDLHLDNSFAAKHEPATIVDVHPKVMAFV
ncbi:Cation/H(+) antiporter 14 [Glycine max]|nr:Cation/H(+) antiporter 14 [Glycine max]